MAKKKYYAVKYGVTPGIYETWAECEAQTKGFSGAQHKAFASMADAEKYMIGEESGLAETINSETPLSAEQINIEVNEELKKLTENEVVAFVDGSYSSKEEKSGFGAIIIDDKGIQTPLFKAFTKQLSPEFLELRNVAAELEGVKEAIKWAIAYQKTRIKIYYDYEGIGKWADGSWKANKNITCQYVSFIKEKQAIIDIEFSKVLAHSGIEYNEAADKLAQRALLEKGYKTYDDGSIYFVGFSGDDWKTIIECINEENRELTGAINGIIKIDSNVIGNRQRMVITDSKNRVVINCYSNFNSYVQGKQSVLFQKIIALAIELMKNEQTVIETLNRFHVVTIKKEEVEVKFEQLLPHYNGKRSEKHYNNLLSAIFNTMLAGYMPDYTSLITPIFRAYEYYLHKILGEKMCLSTCDSKGKNNFGYFSKNCNGRYECNSSNISMLNNLQEEFLNDLYNAYHSVRHPYSHWSADDYDTAVITSIEIAREYLIKGLTLIDKYYTLFSFYFLQKEMIRMEKYLFHSIMNTEYLGIVTILDYEMRLNTYLSELVLPSCPKGKKALVDLALKSGINEYRFVAFDVDENGKIILNSNSFVKATKDIENAANFYLKQKNDIVNNSMLSDSQKNEILI